MPASEASAKDKKAGICCVFPRPLFQTGAIIGNGATVVVEIETPARGRGFLSTDE